MNSTALLPPPVRRRDVLDRAVAAPSAGATTPWQLSRFVVVGGVSYAVYAIVFLALSSTSAVTANVVAAVASTALANELHRRVTFSAGRRVPWPIAQIHGGGLSAVALLATSLLLAVLDQAVGDTTAARQLFPIATVTGAIGLVRFLALRARVFPPPLVTLGPTSGHTRSTTRAAYSPGKPADLLAGPDGPTVARSTTGSQMSRPDTSLTAGVVP